MYSILLRAMVNVLFNRKLGVALLNICCSIQQVQTPVVLILLDKERGRLMCIKHILRHLMGHIYT